MFIRVSASCLCVAQALTGAASAQVCTPVTRTFDATPGAAHSTANAIAAIGNQAAFQLSFSARGYRWSGSTAAAVPLLPSSSSIGPNWMLGTVNGRFFFTAGTRLYQCDLDGSNPISYTALSIGSNLIAISPSESLRLVPFGAGVLFPGGGSNEGIELAFGDGTPNGTRVVADISPGNSSSNPSLLLPLAGGVFFFASTAALGAEPYFSDGTAAGTVLLADIAPGTITSKTTNFDSSTIDTAVSFQGRVYFLATPTGTSRDNALYRTNAANNGVELVDLAGIKPTGYLSPTSAGLFFVGFAPGEGSELYITDGTAAGTRIVRDLTPGLAGTGFSFVRPAGDRVYFAAAPFNANVRTLYTSDGTTAGTVQLPSVLASSVNNGIRFGPVVRGKFVFLEQQAPNSHIGITDGTPAGTCAAPGNFTAFFEYSDGRGLAHAATPSRVFLIGGSTAAGNEPRVIDLCPADFDNFGGPPAPADIFAFLAAFFAADPAADFDASGQVSVQDVFSFVAAYFTGCP